MKNFQLLASGIDTTPILHQIQRQPELWDANDIRTTYPNSPHREVSDILVMFNELSEEIVNDKEVIPYPGWYKIPAIRPLVFALMNQVCGVRLGRVIVTKLAPGRQIYAHKDQGAPAEYFSRYQCLLQSLPGVKFDIGGEAPPMSSGQIWFINNKETHSVVNNSGDDRIALIVDCRCE